MVHQGIRHGAGFIAAFGRVLSPAGEGEQLELAQLLQGGIGRILGGRLQGHGQEQAHQAGPQPRQEHG